jgi:sulfite exporter TauE/SafE
MLTEGFFLGLSTGTFCILSCIPVILPFLCSVDFDKKNQHYLLVLLFLAGRLVGYIFVGAVVGYIGNFTKDYVNQRIVKYLFAASYLGIGLLMLLSGIWHNFPQLKLCKYFSKAYNHLWGALYFGFFTGLSLCPPFLAAIERVLHTGGVVYGMLYFFLFFVGTSLFFLPLVGIKYLNRFKKEINLIARFTLILIGLYFFLYLGLIGIVTIIMT